MIASESSRSLQMDQLVFREGLVSIDWGWDPTLPLEMFPHISYAMIQLRWPLEVEDMRKMEEWVSLPSSKGLILLVDDIDWDQTELTVPVPAGHILHNKNVVLLNTPDEWAKDWESHVFMDGKDVLSLGKRLVGLHRVEDRIVATSKMEDRSPTP
ncbi:hypothetical protein DL96DRAFT_1705430 [Flagelloscypha sp. PMI_526]|nr:hypothetical protein DL96DRAFT_1705430 [Flagelloscypha sp. PMI_526]